jgi:serine/threonine-protein kinase RsbW
MNTKSSLRVKAALKNLARIRRFVEQTATALGVDPAAIPELLLAVDEAATNIIVHGYQGQEGPLEVEVERQGDALLIRLRDEAAPFDPTAIPPPDLSLPLEQRPIGGMGIYLMRKCMDQVNHSCPPQGGNELILVKKGVGKMQVKTTMGPVTVLSVAGDIDAATFPQLISEADQVLDKGHVNLVLDLGGVNYISSGGLIALQTIVGRSAARGGKAVLCCLREQVTKVLKISGFDQRLSIFPDVAAAKASFGQA